MIKIIRSFAIIIAFSFAGQAFAGTGHSHGVSEPLSQGQAMQRATSIKQQLVSSKEIPAAWQEVADGNAEQRSTPAGNLWVVEFANPEAADESEAKLFVFVDEFGNPVAANHSGEL